MQETPYPVTRKRASAGAQHYTVTRRPAYTQPSDDDNDLYDYPRMPTSSIRYDRQTEQGYQQRQLPSPKRQRSRPERYHVLVYVGLTLVCAVLLLIISSVIANL